ncbi:GNAT family N-acetyltransferase, partial [Brevundimonas sp.]|uniref:GNAT family N-acetyltransferase n=1 Tax=Brevundimonas sp. TaxID=1871086 RepID=UPI002FCAA395
PTAREARGVVELLAGGPAPATLGLPVLTAEIDGEVAGYAYAGPYRLRAAYRYMVEDSIYLAPEARGKGIGGLLLDALIDSCTKMGLRQMVAVIGDSENEGSIALHRSRGFADSGIFHAAGWKHDGWRDVIFMQKPLNSGGDAPPDSPGLAIKDTH